LFMLMVLDLITKFIWSGLWCMAALLDLPYIWCDACWEKHIWKSVANHIWPKGHYQGPKGHWSRRHSTTFVAKVTLKQCNQNGETTCINCSQTQWVWHFFVKVSIIETFHILWGVDS
jgi:hypothetical protein